MSFRLLLNPTTTEGTPPPAAAAAPAASPVFAQPPRAEGAAPITVPLTVDEYNRLRGLERQLDDFRREQATVLAAKEAEAIKALADKGQVEEALNQQRTSWEAKHAEALTKYTQLEQQVYTKEKAATLNSALAGRTFVGETPEARSANAAMLIRLLQDDFETTRDASGVLVVRDKVSGRPAAEMLRERLDSPQFAIFFAATRSGGSGADGTRTTAATPTADDARRQLLAGFGIGPAQDQSGLTFR